MALGGSEGTNICVAVRNHVEVMIPAATGCYRQGRFFYSTVHDCRLTTENERHWRCLWQPPPTSKNKPTKNSPHRKLLKRVLKSCHKMLKSTSLLTAEGFWQMVGWARAQFSLRCWPLGVRPHPSEYMSNINWTWWWVCFVLFACLFWGQLKGGKVELGWMGIECTQGALYKIPK